MIRFVEIKNLADHMIEVGDRTIQPRASLVITYDNYNTIALENDLGQLPVSVSRIDSSLRYALVSDFGAKGDGITDDTQAIQNAIDSVALYGGGVVEIPIGVFVISRIAITGNVSIVGQSRESSVLKQKGDTTDAPISFDNATARLKSLSLVVNS